MHRIPQLPLLPGFSFNRNIGRTNFHINPYFDKIHEGVYYLKDSVDRNDFSNYPSIYPRGEVQELPPWIVYDGQRLMFKAFYQETVQERWKAPFQIRKVIISFFLEDGTMKICEPFVDNSGLDQGILVKRQRMPMPHPVNHRFYDIIDLNIGKEPEIFGRVYKIVDCDQFTRRFLNRMGIAVPDPIDVPKDPYSELRKVDLFPKKPSRKMDTRGDFLKYDRKVLRFSGYWDDTESCFGTLHDLQINYYLADGTIEIKEIVPNNSGHDSGILFVRRMKIPKFFTAIEPIGSADPVTVLNVMGDEATRSYSMKDSLDPGKNNKDYYKDNELTIGAQINVFGRKIVLTDMDSFTKEFYRTKYGMDDFTPLERPQKPYEACVKVERYVPPYNGYGSYDDSLGNCISVRPKPPKTDFIKFLHYDRYGFDTRILRFYAKMISNIPVDKNRIFIITIFLVNDTISVFELAKRNSGFKRCLFQKRMLVMLPGQEIFTNKKPEFYKPGDLFVGARINLNSFIFEIVSADSYALRFMELHCDKFPKANAKLIKEKIRQALKDVYKEFVQLYAPSESVNKTLSYEKLREALCKYLGDKITEHEIITIARHYSPHEKKEFRPKEYVRRLMHTEMTRFLWDELDRLEEDLHKRDRGRTGFLHRNTIYSVLRGSRIPVDVELLNAMLDHIYKRDDGKLDYNDLLRFMNVKINPLPPVYPTNVKAAFWWASEKDPAFGIEINWCAFIEDMKVEENKGEVEKSKEICEFIK